LLSPNDPRQPYVESYRHLRSALLLSTMGQSRPQILLFTGAAPAEGKTTVAINLARVLAASGLRITLVDADPHGSVNKLLSVEGDTGVLDFLRGEAGVASIIHPTGTPGLTFVPIGSGAERAEGLFLQPKLGELVNELKTNCDYIIVDGAPILATDDAALWVPYADAVILVVRPFYSRSNQIRRTLEMLYQRQAKNVAIIFNRARAEDLAGHYYENGYRARKAKSPVKG
jgi:capsular exopolysaccharide synthesis family protein